MFPQLQQLAALLVSQEAGPGGAGGCGGPNQILVFPVMFAIMYFVWLRPTTKERKDHLEMMKGLKRGDKIITTSGIIGSIADKSEKTVVVQLDKNTKVEMLLSAVARRYAEPAASSGSTKTESKKK